MNRTFRIGSRGSKLAIAQANTVLRALKLRFPKHDFKIVIIETRGDRILDLSVFNHKATGIFTKEIERALLEKRVDLAVHSLKDLPTSAPRGLVIAAYLKRDDPRDALVTRNGFLLRALPEGSKVGTSSPRRARQLAILRPDLRILPLRGNLTTRIERVRAGSLDGIVVAQAGLNRIKNRTCKSRVLRPTDILPAPGQGILAVQARKSDIQVLRIVKKLNHRPTQKEATAERELLKKLQGGCRVPLGTLARVRGRALHMEAAVFSTRNHNAVRNAVTQKDGDPKKAALLLSRALIRKGALRFLNEARDV